MNFLENRMRADVFYRIANGILSGNFDKTYVLDIACGSFNVLEKLVDEGSLYLGIEGRQENIDIFKKNIKIKHLDNVKIYKKNVVKISKEEEGEFDLVFVPGILYHLSLEDNYKLLTSIKNMAKKAIVIDTLIQRDTYHNMKYFIYNGYIFSGLVQKQYNKKDTKEIVEKRLRSVYLDNVETEYEYISVTLSKSSLLQMLRMIGYKTISEYDYQNMLNEIPTPPIKNNDIIEKTVFMNGERAIFVVNTNEPLNEIKDSGVFRNFDNGFFVDDLNVILNILQNEIAIYKNSDELQQKVYELSSMIPSSLYILLLFAILRNKLNISNIVSSRVYLEAYLKYSNYKEVQKNLLNYLLELFEYLDEINEIEYVYSFSKSLYMYFNNYINEELLEKLKLIYEKQESYKILKD